MHANADPPFRLPLPFAFIRVYLRSKLVATNPKPRHREADRGTSTALR